MCTIYSDTEIGRKIATVFTGFTNREFGEQKFKIDHFILLVHNDDAATSKNDVAA